MTTAISVMYGSEKVKSKDPHDCQSQVLVKALQLCKPLLIYIDSYSYTNNTLKNGSYSYFVRAKIGINYVVYKCIIKL